MLMFRGAARFPSSEGMELASQRANTKLAGKENIWIPRFLEHSLNDAGLGTGRLLGTGRGLTTGVRKKTVLQLT